METGHGAAGAAAGGDGGGGGGGGGDNTHRSVEGRRPARTSTSHPPQVQKPTACHFPYESYHD